jgi:hypothetical protein
VGISPASDQNSSGQLTAIGGAEFKDRPDASAALVDPSSPEVSLAPLPDNVSSEAVTSAPVAAPDGTLENGKPERATVAARIVRTPPSPANLPATPLSGRIQEAVRNISPAVVLRAPAPSASDPVSVLIERGDAMLALHDIGAARLLYERAAKAGNSRAATGVGKTFDPNFLRTEGAVGLQPNRSEAINWYRKAAALGDPEAAVRLRQLQN